MARSQPQTSLPRIDKPVIQNSSSSDPLQLYTFLSFLSAIDSFWTSDYTHLELTPTKHNSSNPHTRPESPQRKSRGQLKYNERHNISQQRDIVIIPDHVQIPENAFDFHVTDIRAVDEHHDEETIQDGNYSEVKLEEEITFESNIGRLIWLRRD